MFNRKRIYYGWYIVLASSIIVLLTMGMRMGIGPFIDPMMSDFGLTRTELSIIVAIGMIVYGLGMPIAGMLLKQFSTKTVILTGLVIVCFSILWTIYANGFISLLLSFGIGLSVGLSFLSNITLSPIVSKWFIRQRGKALFYLTTGGMAGIAIMTPLETWLISLIGWKQTLLVFSGIFIVFVVPTALFIMKENVPVGADRIEGLSKSSSSKVPLNISIKDAFKTRAFWQITFGLFACGFGMNLLGSHGVPMLIDHQFNPMIASLGVGTIGAVAIFSTLILGQLADRFPRKYILFFVYFVRGLGFFGLVLSTSNWQLFFVAVCGGFVWSGSIAMSTAILSDLYGVNLLGLLNGWAFFIGHQFGAAIGSFLGGWAYEVFGTHLISFGMAGTLAIFASIASITLPQHISFSKNIDQSVQRNIEV